MQQQDLVRVNKYSNRIKELPITKRIAIDYPLLCRKAVAKKLAIIAEKLPSGLYLQVDSAYRSKKTEQVLWNSRKDIIPGLVINPTENKSSHNTGGAVDISFTDVNGKEINLSEPFQKYYQEPQLISYKITPKAQELRQLLYKLMLGQNFVAHPKEYWHFSYGEKRWADYTKKQQLYFELSIGKEVFYPLPQRLLNRIFRKLWKLFNRAFRIQTNY